MLIHDLSDVIRREESGKGVWKLLTVAFSKGVQRKLWIYWVSQHVIKWCYINKFELKQNKNNYWILCMTPEQKRKR